MVTKLEQDLSQSIYNLKQEIETLNNKKATLEAELKSANYNEVKNQMVLILCDTCCGDGGFAPIDVAQDERHCDDCNGTGAVWAIPLNNTIPRNKMSIAWDISGTPK